MSTHHRCRTYHRIITNDPTKAQFGKPRTYLFWGVNGCLEGNHVAYGPPQRACARASRIHGTLCITCRQLRRSKSLLGGSVSLAYAAVLASRTQPRSYRFLGRSLVNLLSFERLEPSSRTESFNSEEMAVPQSCIRRCPEVEAAQSACILVIFI